MKSYRRVIRLLIVLGIIAGLIVMPAAPAMAGSSHVTFSFVALPPALTFSTATSTRFGLVKANFGTVALPRRTPY